MQAKRDQDVDVCDPPDVIAVQALINKPALRQTDRQTDNPNTANCNTEDPERELITRIGH